MTNDKPQGTTGSNLRATRLHAIVSCILAPIALAIVFWLWFLLIAEAAKNPGSGLIKIARFALAPFAFALLIWTPVVFIAGIVQIASGKRNKLVEGFYAEMAKIAQSKPTVPAETKKSGTERSH